MAKTLIDWATDSWNPIRAVRGEINSVKVGWHCEHVSEGCRNCYAEGFNKRLGTGLGYTVPNRGIVDCYLDETAAGAIAAGRRAEVEAIINRLKEDVYL